MHPGHDTTPSRRHARPVRVIAVAAVMLAAAATSAWATDHYVRPDGNDSNSGTSNSPSGAWASVQKCAASLDPGDRCLIAAGTYFENQGDVNLAREGRLKRDNAATCTCTEGSTTVSCQTDVSSLVDAGDHVSCDGSPYYGWTHVQSVSGSTITLSEPYVGVSESNGRLDVAEMIVFQGIGPTLDDVVITSWVDQPGSVSWTKEPGLSCVYSYTKSSASGMWRNPESFREDVPDSAWDWYDANDNGADPYVRIESASDMPCPSSTVQGNVDQVRRAWGQDSTKVYLRTEDCTDPDTKPMQAGLGGSHEDIFLDLRGDYVVIRDLRIEMAKPLDTPVLRDPMAYALLIGDAGGMNSVRLSNVRIATGRLQYISGSSNRKTLISDIWSLGSADMPDGTWSGLIIEGHFSRNAQWSVDAFRGTSESDRIILRRNRISRTFPRTDTGDFDCALNDFPPSQYYRGGHGLYIGSTEANRDHSHMLLENNIFEMTFDGLQIAGNSATDDVIVRNNTFGLSKSASLRGNQKAFHGTNASPGAKISYYNNLILGAFDMGGAQNSQGWLNLFPNDNTSGVTSDYNLYVFTGRAQGFSGDCPRIWDSGHDFDVVQQSFGQETNSILVCASGCSCPVGTVFNDGPRAHGVRDFETADGDEADYTPSGGTEAANRGVNRGLNSQCPDEDFFGNPRADGQCDIGAVELGGGPPDTTPPAPVTGFVATPGDAQVSLSWTHSSSSDSVGTRVRFRTDRHPSGPADGQLVCDVVGTPGSAGSCDHTGLTNGQAYYYSAFSYDGADNHAAPAQDTATPSAAPTGPDDVTGLERTDTKG